MREKAVGRRERRQRAREATGKTGGGGGFRPRGLGLGGAGGPRLQKLLFAIDEGVDVVGGQFDAVAVGDGVGGAGFDAVAAENAARVVYVVGLRIALARRNTIGGGIFGSFDVDAIRRTGCGAEKTAYALFVAVLVALQNMDAAVAGLHAGGHVRETFGRSFAKHRA